MKRSNTGNGMDLGALVQGVLRRSGLERRVKQGQVILAWKEIVGPVNARHSWPIRVKDGVLLVGCSSAAWSQTMMMLRTQILEKIETTLGECPIRDIHFSGVRRPTDYGEIVEDTTPRPVEIPLQVEQQQQIEQLTGDIADPLLRRKARAAMTSLMRQRIWHETQHNRPCARCGRMHREKGSLCLTCRREPSPCPPQPPAEPAQE